MVSTMDRSVWNWPKSSLTRSADRSGDAQFSAFPHLDFRPPPDPVAVWPAAASVESVMPRAKKNITWLTATRRTGILPSSARVFCGNRAPAGLSPQHQDSHPDCRAAACRPADIRRPPSLPSTRSHTSRKLPADAAVRKTSMRVIKHTCRRCGGRLIRGAAENRAAGKFCFRHASLRASWTPVKTRAFFGNGIGQRRCEMTANAWPPAVPPRLRLAECRRLSPTAHPLTGPWIICRTAKAGAASQGDRRRRVCHFSPA